MSACGSSAPVGMAVADPVAGATVTGDGCRPQASAARACCRRVRELSVGMEGPPGLECSAGKPPTSPRPRAGAFCFGTLCIRAAGRGLSRPPPYPGMRRKIHADTPSLADLRAAVELDPVDRREGSWTRLELFAMNERFAATLRRAHPKSARVGGAGEPVDEGRAPLDEPVFGHGVAAQPVGLRFLETPSRPPPVQRRRPRGGTSARNGPRSSGSRHDQVGLAPA